MIKKYEMVTGTFYLQELPIMNEPSPPSSALLELSKIYFDDGKEKNEVDGEDIC